MVDLNMNNRQNVYEKLREFVETGRIGEYILDNSSCLCAVYNIYEGGGAKKNLSDFYFFIM